MRKRRFFVLVLTLVWLGGSGCYDAAPPVVPEKIVKSLSGSVDLIVMVDNSNSMAQEQANLTAEFQTMIDALTDPADEDGDGEPDRPAVSDLHVGIVSSDMGTGGWAVQTCDNPNAGDDGILMDTSDVPGCEVTYPRYLTFCNDPEDEDCEPGHDDPVIIAQDFACVATLGTGGCGFEQQLKAVKKALITHAEGANQGFLRPDSLLAIMIVTDEEDCSVRDDPNASDIFNTNLALGPLNLRCFSHRDQYVEPVGNYVDAILSLRPDDPERVVVAAIVGIPPSTRNQCNLERMRDADFQCLLDLPEMQEVIDNSAEGKGERLTPSCDEPGLGEAYPPRRIVEFVRQINRAGNGGIVRSICEQNIQPAMREIANLIQANVRCLARPLEVDADGRVGCIIQEHTRSGDVCAPGRIDVGDVPGRLCQLCQEGDGLVGRELDPFGTDVTRCAPFNEQAQFWRYVPGEETEGECTESGKLEFVGATAPAPSSTVELVCLQ